MLKLEANNQHQGLGRALLPGLPASGVDTRRERVLSTAENCAVATGVEGGSPLELAGRYFALLKRLLG